VTDDEEQPAEVAAHLRATGNTSAAQLATMSRLRTDFVDLGGALQPQTRVGKPVPQMAVNASRI
jgi:hypothetical protein